MSVKTINVLEHWRTSMRWESSWRDCHRESDMLSTSHCFRHTPYPQIAQHLNVPPGIVEEDIRQTLERFARCSLFATAEVLNPVGRRKSKLSLRSFGQLNTAVNR
jgi:hypothetical protein